MKKVLFVINTLGQAGAETALLELLRRINPDEYEISLYVLMGQGEMRSKLPHYVKVLNRTYCETPVLNKAGKSNMMRTVVRAFFKRASGIRLFPYLVSNCFRMICHGRVLTDKLLWRVLSDGADQFDQEFDLAVAYLEGGSTYYVADWVKAAKKAAFVHVDYEKAGYTRKLDKDCYNKFDRVFTVSDEVKKVFLQTYPECEKKVMVFHNIIDGEAILEKSLMGEGFQDRFEGMRILTVGRLTAQKAFDVSIEAMKLLKEAGENVRWYVLGEGDQRKRLEEQISKLDLKEDFLLPGAVDNPYPYMRQADIYVHCSRFEGKSIAIQEAQILGKPMVVSDCSVNRERVNQNVDGILCDFDAKSIYEAISRLLHDEATRERLGRAAKEKNASAEAETDKLLSMIGE